MHTQMKITNGQLVYTTHRKPLCAYAYTPFDSNHALQTRLGIIATELVRLLRTNSSESAFNAQTAFFKSKLKSRGYDINHVDALLPKYRWEHKHIFAKDCVQTKKLVVPFKFSYCEGAERIGIGAILNKHAEVLGQKVQKIKLVQCFLTSANLFRLRYKRFFGEV